MTVRRDDDTVLLEDVCAVEDAEILMRELQSGATAIDWSGCTHLHTACFQVLLAARVPVHGTPAAPALLLWLGPILEAGAAAPRRPAAALPETAFEVEA